MSTPLLSKVLQKYGKASAKMKDSEQVETLLQDIVSKGFDSLQVISDFDHTLSRYHKDGVVCATCHWAIHHSKFVTDEYRQLNKVIYDKYFPIEIDHTMTDEEKLPFMVEWYQEKHKLMMTTLALEKDSISEMVRQSNIQLRDNTTRMLETLHKNQVPVMVFSAGVGDILEVVLNNNGCYYPNTIVVSNFMEFNAQGRLSGFKEPIVHVLNKNEKSVIQSKPSYFKELGDRQNVILLGDAIGDKDMSEGSSSGGAVLKIGFLNIKVEERLDSFLDTFDIVLVDDQSMDFVNALLSEVPSKESNS